MNLKTLSIFVAINVVLFLQVGCGGGGDDGNGDGPVDTGDSVNNGINGQLFMGSSGEGQLLDLSTGHFKEIPGVNWSGSMSTDYHPSATHYATPSKDGKEFIEVVKDCFSGDDPLSPFYDCIVIHNSNGDIISSGKMSEDISRATRFSNNKDYFAFFYNNWRDSSSNDELVIFDRNIQFVGRSQLDGKLARSFDWLNNGQIVYIHDQTIYITSPYSTKGAPIYTFLPEEGRPDYIAASPDGSRIAFTLVTDAYTHVIHGTTWIMNINGTDLHQLAYDPSSNNPIINYPTWSPNGDYILNVVGRIKISPDPYTDDVLDVEDLLGELYAIPSSSRNVMINTDGEDGVVRIRSYSPTSNELTYKFSTNGNMVWIP
ncbi:MAG: hypothetical protein JAY90_19050 [Candidatus Thiodiazotropha lotti]|nr:hypothetical protein [Candidatus Thiodiazotropha lotti]